MFTDSPQGNPVGFKNTTAFWQDNPVFLSRGLGFQSLTRSGI
jgi:hypothetical protein